jgi:hypothetical protein
MFVGVGQLAQELVLLELLEVRARYRLQLGLEVALARHDVIGIRVSH